MQINAYLVDLGTTISARFSYLSCQSWYIFLQKIKINKGVGGRDMHEKNVELGNLIPGEMSFWREIFASV